MCTINCWVWFWQQFIKCLHNFHAEEVSGYQGSPLFYKKSWLDYCNNNLIPKPYLYLVSVTWQHNYISVIKNVHHMRRLSTCISYCGQVLRFTIIDDCMFAKDTYVAALGSQMIHMLKD